MLVGFRIVFSIFSLIVLASPVYSQVLDVDQVSGEVAVPVSTDSACFQEQKLYLDCMEVDPQSCWVLQIDLAACELNYACERYSGLITYHLPGLEEKCDAYVPFSDEYLQCRIEAMRELAAMCNSSDRTEVLNLGILNKYYCNREAQSHFNVCYGTYCDDLPDYVKPICEGTCRQGAEAQEMSCLYPGTCVARCDAAYEKCLTNKENGPYHCGALRYKCMEPCRPQAL